MNTQTQSHSLSKNKALGILPGKLKGVQPNNKQMKSSHSNTRYFVVALA